MSTPQAIFHGIVLAALIAAYTVLTVAGHDGTALIGAFAGYLGGAGTQIAAAKAT